MPDLKAGIEAAEANEKWLKLASDFSQTHATTKEPPTLDGLARVGVMALAASPGTEQKKSAQCYAR